MKVRLEYCGNLVSINKRYIISRRTRSLILSKEYREFLKKLHETFKMQAKLCDIILDCKSKFRVEIEINEKHRNDIDSIVKPLLDSLEGVIYKNDRQVKSLSIEKKCIDKDVLVYFYRL